MADSENSVIMLNWSRGVTVSTLDSESSDRGSNPAVSFNGRKVPNPSVEISQLFQDMGG